MSLLLPGDDFYLFKFPQRLLMNLIFQRVLMEAGGSVELVEVSNLLPGLRFRQGIDKWIVANKEGGLYNSWYFRKPLH